MSSDRAARALFGLLARASPYPLALVAVSLLVTSRAADRRASWIDWASTDLTNLTGTGDLGWHPVGCLLVSALIAEDHLAVWAVLALVGLASLGARIGAGRALGLAFAVHVLASVLSQTMVAVRIGTGALPASARTMSDVGPSYLTVAALVAGVVLAPWAGRVLCAAGYAVLAPSLFDGLTTLDVGAVGHTLSALLAGAGAVAIVLRRRRAPRHPLVASPAAGG